MFGVTSALGQVQLALGISEGHCFLRIGFSLDTRALEGEKKDSVSEWTPKALRCLTWSVK